MSGVPPKRNAAYSITVGLPSQANPAVFQSSPTLAAGDIKVSLDGAAFTNITTLPTAVGASVPIALSAAEMNHVNIVVLCHDASGSEWCDVIIDIQTSVRDIDELTFPTTTGRSIDVASTGTVGIDWANVDGQSTTVNLSGTTIKTATDIATAIAALPTATQNATALLTYPDGIATGITPQGAWRVTLAAVSGASDGFTGVAGATIHYRDPADTKNVITATVDAVGNRSAVTLDTT